MSDSVATLEPPGASRTDLPGGGVSRQRTSVRRRRSWLEYLIVAVLAFVPMLLSQPGSVSDDTKTYLYLDPGRYIRQAVSLWDPNIALGTVTHENIGYLLPMGPYFWLMSELHVPVWVAQRLWMGALLFGAGAGMLYLCRTIRLAAPGSYVAVLAFMFTPYVLQYAGRISVILMPWAGLPWMTAFVILALRRGGWRYPALFALVVALVSGINASSVLYAGIGPALWLPFAVLVLRETTWRKVWSVAWKTGLLCALVCLWWVIGLQVEAAYGVNILKYTETLPSTSSSSSPFEVIRGLGYWFFYGASDQTGNWAQAAVAYTQDLALIALSFLVPTLAFLSATLVRWRHRAYFITLIVVGTVLAVGPYPFYEPSVVSSLFKAFMGDTTAGLALRSTDRASPLLLLGMAVLLGAAVTAVYRRAHGVGLAAGVFVAAAVAGATAPLWTGGSVVDQNVQPASPPDYVHQAAQHLNSTHPGTRVYALPGNNFAAYRWGVTNDTVWPALLTRPFVTHEQQTMGSLPTADILEAVDTPLLEGTMDPNALAPMASLMSAGDVLVQYDQAYERYDSPNPQQLALDFTPTPPGLSDPVSYGTPRPNVSTVPKFNEQALSRPANQGWTAPLVSYTVAKPRPVVRAESLSSPLVVAGNGTGLVSAASAGLLADNPTIFYSGTLDTDAALRAKTLSKPAQLVVTDTNRKQGYRWNGITLNAGYTETAYQGTDILDPFDSPLNLFPDAPANAQSTTVFHGIKSVTASSYGSPTQYFVDQRPAAALDGNLQTAWQTSQNPIGTWWQVNFTSPVTENSINLVQTQTAQPRQVITRVELLFGKGREISVNLGAASRTPAGQTIHFPNWTFSQLTIQIAKSHPTQFHVKAGYQNLVGFAEVRIPGVNAQETVSMPQDLLRSAGQKSITDPLTLLMTRQRSSGFPPRTDPETSLARAFWLPTARSFGVTGQARISALATDAKVDQSVGRTSGATGVVTSSSNRLTGDVTAGATATIDGNPSTSWEPGFGAAHGPGQWVQYDLPGPVTVRRVDLKVTADSQHSVPTAVTLTVGNSSQRFTLPAIADSPVAGSAVDVPLQLGTPLTGQTIRLTVDSVRKASTIEYYSRVPTALPIGIAQVGISGVSAPAPPVDIPTSCRDDLLAVDGNPVWVSVAGTSAAALGRQPLSVSLCGPDAGGLTLGPGNHTLRSAPGAATGFDIDQLALSSAAGGGAGATLAGGQLPVTATGSVPSVQVTHENATSMDLRVSKVSPTTAPFELVLGQSINAGWRATIDGHTLGSPVLVDGFANGWRLDPASFGSAIHGDQLEVSLRWAPQQGVNIALIVSGVAIVACLLIVFVPLLRRRRRVGSSPEADEADGPSGDGVLADREADTDEPAFVGLTRRGRSRTVVTSAWLAVGTGLAAGLIAAPFTGVVVAVATFVAMRFPRMRSLLGIAAVVSLVAAGAFVVIHQAVDPAPANGGWPTGFGAASDLVWAAVLFLGADAACEITERIRRARRRSAPAGETAPAATAPEG